MIGRLRDDAPAAIVFDLDRRPSLARDLATAILASKSTCHIPFVFARSVGEKMERIRAELPDALFTTWDEIGVALVSAIENPPVTVVRPEGHMQRYAGSSLAKKLGVKPGMNVALLGSPPESFEESVAHRMEDAEMDRRVTPQTGMILWFVRSNVEIDMAAADAARWLARDRQVWIVYPKRAGRYKVDFTQNDVRAAGIAAGLVDYKICAVDEDWSGLKFARRKSEARAKR
jgi:hypothetical protein